VEKLLTITQLSELIQVSRSTIYEWTHVGFIPHYKFPKRIMFKISEIEVWLEKRRKKGRRLYKLDSNLLIGYEPKI
jgi:excisionase family DNA binding protein